MICMTFVLTEGFTFGSPPPPPQGGSITLSHNLEISKRRMHTRMTWKHGRNKKEKSHYLNRKGGKSGFNLRNFLTHGQVTFLLLIRRDTAALTMSKLFAEEDAVFNWIKTFPPELLEIGEVKIFLCYTYELHMYKSRPECSNSL